MKKILTVILTVLFMASGLLPVANPAKVEASSKPTTIFLHGWRGDKNSMKPVMRYLSGEKSSFDLSIAYELIRNGKKQVQIEKIPYAGQGTTYYFSPPGGGKSTMQVINFKKQGHINPNKNMVHVVFHQNTQPLNVQEKWLREVLADLKKKKVKKVNLVGHSMGGLLATQLLLNGSPIPVEKLVTLDSPILGAPLGAEAVNGKDLYYGGDVIVKSRLINKKISSNIKVLSFGLKNDIIVPDKSSKGLVYFTNKNQFNHKIVNSSHTGITSNSGVLKDTSNFLK